MEKQFKKGEYYVVLKDDDREEFNWTNYIFEQDYDSNNITPIKRKNGLFNYGDQTFNYDNSSTNWYRLATFEEIQHYKALGVPYDVTTLKPIVYKQNYSVLLNILKYINNYEKI
jgi:hypothetical protein